MNVYVGIKGHNRGNGARHNPHMEESRTVPRMNEYFGIKERYSRTLPHMHESRTLPLKAYISIKGREAVTNSHIGMSYELSHIWMYM